MVEELVDFIVPFSGIIFQTIQGLHQVENDISPYRFIKACGNLHVVIHVVLSLKQIKCTVLMETVLFSHYNGSPKFNVCLFVRFGFLQQQRWGFVLGELLPLVSYKSGD